MKKKTPPPLGSVNARVTSPAWFNGHKFTFDGTTLDLVVQALANNAAAGDVVIAAFGGGRPEDGMPMLLIAAPSDQRAGGVWAEEIRPTPAETAWLEEHANKNERELGGFVRRAQVQLEAVQQQRRAKRGRLSVLPVPTEEEERAAERALTVRKLLYGQRLNRSAATGRKRTAAQTAREVEAVQAKNARLSADLRAAVDALLPAGVRLLDVERSGATVFAAVASERALNTKEVGGVKCWQWWTSLPNAEVSLLRRTT